MYFSKNLLLYSQEWIRQTKYIVNMMTKDGSTKIMTQAGVLVLGHGHIIHNCKNALFL